MSFPGRCYVGLCHLHVKEMLHSLVRPNKGHAGEGYEGRDQIRASGRCMIIVVDSYELRV